MRLSPLEAGGLAFVLQGQLVIHWSTKGISLKKGTAAVDGSTHQIFRDKCVSFIYIKDAIFIMKSWLT